ncbi:MAG: hypothetical protein ACYS5V_00160 [Planctomycetota bacterium]
MFKREIRASIVALFLLSAGGLLLHIRFHPPGTDLFNWVPVAVGAVSALAVPVLFNYRRTMPWAYVLNLTAVIVGTVTMAYFWARTWPGAVTWDTVLLESTLPDILVLLAKVPLGEQILRHFRRLEAGTEGEGAS